MGKTSHMDESQVMVQMKDIVKKFGNFTANDHINLTVHKGEVHAILGENGAGKSTMMNVLCGLYKPTSGQIFIKGERGAFFQSKGCYRHRDRYGPPAFYADPAIYGNG